MYYVLHNNCEKNMYTGVQVRLLRVLGVDAVGMSTIPETLVAHHCGIQVSE